MKDTCIQSVSSQDDIAKWSPAYAKTPIEASSLHKKSTDQATSQSREMSRSERKYRNIFDFSSIAILELEIPALDAIHNQGLDPAQLFEGVGSSLYITNANKTALKILEAQSIEDFQGRPFIRFMKDAKCFSDWLGSSHSLSEPLTCETVLWDLSGEEHIVILTANISEFFEDTAILVSFTDVTENRLLQKQMRQVAKLASLGEMAASIAHEINQPLHTIHMANQMIEEEVEFENVNLEFIKERSETINRMVKRTKKIIDHLRNFGYNSSGQSFSNIDPHAAIENSIELVKQRLRLHGIKLTKDFCQSPIKIKGNSNQIEQVYVNFLVNAFDALEQIPAAQSKYIRIETKILKQKSSFQVRFLNNGPEIPQHIIKKVFDPFFTTKAVGKGTGLGLSISFRIIQAHGASLRVESTDKQTCFEIIFPIAEKRQGALLNTDPVNQKM